MNIPRIVGVAAIVLLALPALPAAAQERELEASTLPRDMVDRLVRIVNDPSTTHMDGPAKISDSDVIPGDVVVLGSLELSGTVERHVIVIGGDVDLRPGFVVGGDITVVDGEIRGDELGRIGGFASQFSRAMAGRPDAAGGAAAMSVPLGRDAERGASSHFAVRVGDYNRVEGLQLLTGPVFTTGGRTPFRASALLVWRTEHDTAPLGPNRVGYRVELEQFLGAHRRLRVGGGVHSVVSPVEMAGISDRESAWASLLFTSDQRDHFHRGGWSAFVRATPRSLPFDARLTFEREEHRTMAAADPWSAFGGDRGWRDQPLVAEGSVRSVSARVGIDTREGQREPSGGWLVDGTVRHALGGSLAYPEELVLPPGGGGGPVGPMLDAEFTTGLVDVRRYNAVGRGARLNLRVVAGGSLDGEPLPPQYQHALGGVGSLPGHPHFTADCGARGSGVGVEAGEAVTPMRAFYGCDRFALFQAEYRSPLNLRAGFGAPEAGRGSGRLGERPRWAVFFNAGRGWSEGAWGDLPRFDSGALYGAGLGLLLGDGGIYWAMPIGEDVSGGRWFVRLERRF